MSSLKVAFYAPIKPPDHHIPSGDREIARLLLRALELAGHDVRLASKFIAYLKRPDADLFEQKRELARAEAASIIEALNSGPASDRPDVWITYHPYCKAPDWIGPAVSSALQIPYATVEACRTSREDHPVWCKARQHVQATVTSAAVNFCLKPTDRQYLESFLPDAKTIVDLPPFVDTAELRGLADGKNAPFQFDNGLPVLVAVGMMRPGKKQDCYDILAGALSQIKDEGWNLVLVGDGPARPAIEALFGFVPSERICMTGALKRQDVMACLANSDIMVWPGYREPIGMVYLEAGAVGLPVVALKSMGVPNVVSDGKSGVLVAENDTDALAAAIAGLANDPDRRAALGKYAKSNVERRHAIGVASALMSKEIGRITSR